MQENKISVSLTTIIVIAVIIGVLVGIVAFTIYNNVAPNSMETANDKKEQSNNSTSSFDTNTITNSYTNTSDEKNNSTTNFVTGKSSSKQNPLSIGEWGIASKYVSGEYVDVPVKVTNITRGSVAAQEVEDYCNDDYSIYKYEDAKENMEWAVIEYSVDLTKMQKDSSIRMDTKITGTGNNTSIKYNGYTYIVSTLNMSSGYSKGEIIPCKFAVQLPIGCTDYLIAIGSSSSTQAFFNGK